MTLLIDIGNSQIVFGVAQNNKIIRVFRIESLRNRSIDEYYLLLQGKIKELIKNAIISSVVPVITEKILGVLKNHYNINPLILGKGTKSGLSILTDNPKEVGSDLICDACGLLAQKEEGLIIDLGTATKFVYLEGNALKGVVIAPGVRIALEALINKTALLPEIDIEAPKKVLGLNSVSSMQSGVAYGFAALLDGMIQRIRKEVNKPNLKVYATGGLTNVVVPLCQEDIIVRENLLLEGLLYIFQKN
ncbi:MAG: type III pantothenate kinase [Erysipelotrichales bacterium]|nr:type III pantothenate kinase [Erysipelotrichales bacterium]